MSNRHILIVDDLEDKRKLLTAIFEREGDLVHRVANGWQALDAVARATFDLVLTDLDMPLLGGEEFARALRQRFVRTPVIAMSTDPTRLEPANDLPVVAVIQKPFTTAALLALVDDVLQATGKVPPDAAQDRPS